MVLDGVVRSAGQETRNGGPLISMDGVSPDDDGVFIGSKRAVLYAGAKLIAPSEPARLAGATWYVDTDERPIARAVLVDEVDERGVLLGAPRAFHSIIGSDVVV